MNCQEKIHLDPLEKLFAELKCDANGEGGHPFPPGTTVQIIRL
jgi:hypothetical protein